MDSNVRAQKSLNIFKVHILDKTTKNKNNLVKRKFYLRNKQLQNNIYCYMFIIHHPSTDKSINGTSCGSTL